MLVKKILRGIPDEYKMSSFINVACPVTDLINEYNKYCYTKSVGTLITGETTGLELKENIRQMDPEYAMQLLSNYQKAVTNYDNPVTPADEDEKKTILGIKSFSIKALLVFFISMALILTISYLNTSTEPDKEKKVLTAVSVSTKDIINTIFGIKPKTDKETKDK